MRWQCGASMYNYYIEQANTKGSEMKKPTLALINFVVCGKIGSCICISFVFYTNLRLFDLRMILRNLLIHNWQVRSSEIMKVSINYILPRFKGRYHHTFGSANQAEQFS